MRVLLILAALAIVGLAVGIIHIQRTGNTIDITIDKARLKQTTTSAIQKGERVLHDAESSFDNEANRAASDATR